MRVLKIDVFGLAENQEEAIFVDYALGYKITLELNSDSVVFSGIILK